MKKIILTFIAMLLAGVNTAWADDVAQIGETKYQSLSTAFADANDNSGSTLYLLKDVTLDDGVTLYVTGNFTLDLNGKKITANSQTTSSTNDNSRDGCAILLMRGATLTIDDASGNNSGTISNTNASGQAAIRVLDSRHQPSDYNATTVKTTLVINGGTFTCGDNGKNAIAGYGRCHNTDIIINGGVITGGRGCGIYHPQIGTLTINGGSISGASAAVVMHAGTLTIADGTFEATSTWDGNASTPIPAAIRIIQYNDEENSGLQKPIEVNINGGTFIATQDGALDVPTDTDTDSKALTVTNTYNNDEAMGSVVVNIIDGDFQGGILKTDTRTTTKINISGGTYRYIVDEANCAENCSPVTTPNNDGKYTVINNVPAVIDGEVQVVSGNTTTPYQTLADAFAAVQDGETIELLKKVTLSSDIVCPLTSGTIYFKFGSFKVNKGNSSIKLKIAAANGARAAVPAATVGGPVVYTDNQTDIFTAAGSGNVLLVNYDPTNATYPYSYQSVPGDQSIDEAVARNEETGMLFSDLQLAIDLASAGQTIELLPGIENVTLDKTVVINKNLTIEGGDYQVTSEVTASTLYDSRLDPAFHITGPGSVTLNKVNIVAPYVVPGHDGPGMYDQYTSGSVGIVVDHQFNDSLVINYSTITTTGRGIDILSIGGGFVLDVKHSTITTTDDDPSTPYGAEAPEFDPTKVYINSFEGDPYGRGRGINFGNNATTCVANIQFSKIQGYAYPINVGEFNVNTGKVVLNMTDCSTWGRDVINNWGDQSTFNLDNITAHGYNNELSANNESFAAIVDYKNADLNFYNIKDLKVISNVKASDAAPTSASEKFIDLRGTNTTVKIVGNSGYEIPDSLKDRVGFVNTNLSDEDVNVGPTDAYLRMIDTSVNNRIYFDDQAKSYFNYWFEILDWILYNNDSDPDLEKIRIAIDDEKDHTNLYPVVPLEVKVMLTITPKGSSVNKDFYFGKLQDAFNSEFFDDFAVITILDNITMNEDITPDLKRGENFTLQIETEDDGNGNITKKPWTLEPNGHNIFLNPLVVAYYEEDNADDLFAPSDDVNTTILGVDGVYYTAANVYWATDVDGIGNDIADQYWLFDELFTYHDSKPYFTPGTYTRLEMDLKLERDLKLPTDNGGGITEFGKDEINEVLGYTYPDNYSYVGSFQVVDGLTMNYTIDLALAANNALSDLARFLGALYHAGSVDYIIYDGVKYEWDTQPVELKGSNWRNGTTTLVSVIAAQFTPTNIPESISISTNMGDLTVYINPTNTGGNTGTTNGNETKQPYWLDFNDCSIEKGDYSIILQLSDTVYTTKLTDIFSSFSPEYTVVYDAVSEEKTLEDGTSTVTFLYKYYLLKDGLAITVDPATFCGDRLTPSFVVKKKFTEVDPQDPSKTIDVWRNLSGVTKTEYDNIVSAATNATPPTEPDFTGIDFYWYLVPPASDDDDSTYVSAKTYVQALVIEGISFQGTRKADFTILPRDIKDVTVSGNEQPWREAGYTPAQIEDLIKLVYECSKHGTDTTLIKNEDYIITVANGPGSDGNTAQNAINYVYPATNAYTYDGTFTQADAQTIEYYIKPATANANGVVKDLARFLGALYHAGGVTKITYGTVDYTWSIEPDELRGSNWRDASNKTLVKTIIDQFTPNLPSVPDHITFTTDKGDVTVNLHVTDDAPAASSGYYQDVDTYSKVITITAIEGRNYTGTLKVDFTILPDNLIDISKCMVVSNAVYTSDTLPPTYKRISVIYKKTDNGVEVVDTLDQNQFTIDVHGLSASYVNAKTYSNAITLRGVPENGYYGTLDADYVIKPRDLADSLDVIAEKDNQGKVTLEAYAGANKPATTPATIYLKWTGSELLPVINGAVTDPVSNNINLILTAQKDTLPGQSTSAKVVYPLIASDYSYTIEPAPMVDPGIYKIIFTGRGNFTGMREVNVMVLKDINSPSIASEVPLQIIPNNDNLKPSELKDIVVKDGDQTLVLGTHYSVTVIGQDKTEYTETNPIITDSIYSVIFKGIEPYYYEADTTEMIVLYEFYSYDTDNNGGAYYNRQPNGYVPADTAMSIRVLSGKELNCLVGDYPKSRKSAIDSTLLTFTIPETATIKIDMGTTTGIYAFNLKVVGIEDSSFYSCDTLHWVDATAIKGYTPSTLSRSDVGPFAGYPVQSLVYLDGSSVSGTNYVYEVSPGTFECEELKIYDDQQGKQKGFTEGGGPKWEFWNKYEFTADKVTNTRYFLAGQHYTTCLPYRMEMPADMKVYTLDAASDKIFGFKELSLDSLRAFTPYLLIPSKAGNMLNNSGSTIVYVTPTADADEGKLNPVVTPTGSATPNATMYGSMIYMDKNTTAPTTTTAIYIMQSENKWKKIPADKEYDDACVLPMRAYIQVPVTSPAREYIMGKIIDSVEHPTVEVADDWSNAEVYDLQGRKVDTTARLPKGVYIVNGQKRIRK